jgi:hypothetical protein
VWKNYRHKKCLQLSYVFSCWLLPTVMHSAGTNRLWPDRRFPILRMGKYACFVHTTFVPPWFHHLSWMRLSSSFSTRRSKSPTRAFTDKLNNTFVVTLHPHEHDGPIHHNRNRKFPTTFPFEISTCVDGPIHSNRNRWFTTFPFEFFLGRSFHSSSSRNRSACSSRCLSGKNSKRPVKLLVPGEYHD